jgi:hypothetical protein
MDPREQPVGLKEIGTRLGVAKDTPKTWHHRGVLPESGPGLVHGHEWWPWGVIEDWARATGRFPGSLEDRNGSEISFASDRQRRGAQRHIADGCYAEPLLDDGSIEIRRNGFHVGFVLPDGRFV